MLHMASELEKKIGYEFRDPSLLETALVTPSCRMVNPELEDNQRLEFLGDAVFGLLSADAVYEAYPWEQEGQLTVRRTHLVSGAALIEAAKIENIQFEVDDERAQLGDVITVLLPELDTRMTVRVIGVMITSQKNKTTREISVGTPIPVKVRSRKRR